MPILAPRTAFSILGAVQNQKAADQRVLIVGQMIAGTATAGALTQDIPDSDTALGALFGIKAHVTAMAKKFKLINKNTPVDVIALADDGSAVDSTSTLTLVGTSTAEATITVFVGDKANQRATVTIPTASSETVAAAAITAALVAAETKWTFDTTSAVGVVTVTGANGGTTFNGSPIGVEGTIPGIAITIAAFASGATDPTLTSIFDVIGNTRYQTIVWPAAYATTELTTLLSARENDDFEVLDGVGITGIVDTYANLNGGPSENLKSISILADVLVDEADRKGAAIMNLPDHKSAAYAAVRSLRLTQDASLTGIMTTVAPADQFGGPGSSTIPYHNTLLAGLSVPDTRDEFSNTEIDDLTGDGYTVAAANKAFNSVVLGDAVTTYKTNVAGDPDTSFHFLNTVDASSTVRETYVLNLRAKYAQTRLADGDLTPRRDMANEASIRSFCKQVYKILSDDAVLETGVVAEKDYNDNLTVVVSVSTGQVTINQEPLLVGQLRVQIGTIAVKFSS